MGKALRIQRRVIGALIMREVHTRYGRDNIGFLWVLGEPLMFAFGVEGMWTLLNCQEHNIPLVPFLLTGYLPLLMWRHVNNRALPCIAANRGLLFHSQVTILDLFLARFILEIAGVLLAFIFAYLLFYIIGVMEPPKYIWSIYCGWFLMIWFSLGTGLILGPLAELSDVVEKVYHPASYLMLPICGTFYLVEWLPYQYRSWALYIPMVNAIELIRGGYFGDWIYTYSNIPFACAFCAAETLIGLLLVSYIRRRIHFE